MTIYREVSVGGKYQLVAGNTPAPPSIIGDVKVGGFIQGVPSTGYTDTLISSSFRKNSSPVTEPNKFTPTDSNTVTVTGAPTGTTPWLIQPENLAPGEFLFYCELRQTTKPDGSTFQARKYSTYYGRVNRTTSQSVQTRVAFDQFGFVRGVDPEYATYAVLLRNQGVKNFLLTSTYTYAATTALIDAANPADYDYAFLGNLETPWLGILTATAVNGAWISDANVIGERTRQVGLGRSFNAIGSMTLAEFQDLTQYLWNSVSTYAISKGFTTVCHYSTPPGGFSVGGVYGVPSSAKFLSMPGGITTNWWTTGSTANQWDDRWTAQAAANTTKQVFFAHRNATHHGVAFYNFAPLGGLTVNDTLVTNIASTDTRKNSSNTTISPPALTLPDVRYWVGDTVGDYIRKYKEQYVGATGVALNELPSKTIAIHLEGDVHMIWGTPQYYNHILGPAAKNPTDSATYEFAPSFDQTVTTTKQASLPPDEIWYWHANSYYFKTVPGNNVATLLLGDLASQRSGYETCAIRVGLEKAFFKRPIYDAGEPYGSLVDATQDAWYLANNMGDNFWWDSGANPNWWLLAGGNQLPAPCVLDATSPLAPYLNFTANITRAHVKKAILMWLAQRAVDNAIARKLVTT
jgi:hypothetical protein